MCRRDGTLLLETVNHLLDEAVIPLGVGTKENQSSFKADVGIFRLSLSEDVVFNINPTIGERFTDILGYFGRGFKVWEEVGNSNQPSKVKINQSTQSTIFDATRNTLQVTAFSSMFDIALSITSLSANFFRNSEDNMVLSAPTEMNPL